MKARIIRFCLIGVLTVIAQVAMAQRGCRPQLIEKGVPEHARAYHRAALSPSLANRTALFVRDSTYVGDRRQLTVLVSFADRDFMGNEAETMAQWEKILNMEHYNEAPFHGSMHDYFYDQSYGQFRLAFDVHYVALSDSAKKYHSTSQDDDNSKYLVNDILDSLVKRDIDWGAYDWNGNGYVNQLLIIYAGAGMHEGAPNSIWPHQWWLSQHDNWQAYQVEYDKGKMMVDTYCCLPERTRNDTYGTFGTMCHEYSHCFGFPDFYYGNTIIVAGWDLMDYGNYNGDGFVPAGYSSFERAFMGWLNPTELGSDTIVTDMPALADEPQAYLVRNEGHPDEYYLIENRQPTNWDSGLPGSGITIFHVDYDERVFLIENPNNSWKQRYSIFAANNMPYILAEGWGYPSSSGNNKLTNDSRPAATLNNLNADSTLLMSKPITNMVVTNGLAAFDFTSTITGISTSKAQHTTIGIRYNLSGQRVDDSYKGVVIENGKKRIIR